MCALSMVLIFMAGCGNKEEKEGGLAPDFRLRDLSGATVTLEQYRGKTVLLDFWATWCPPCRMSIPELVTIQERYGDRKVAVLGISMDDPAQVDDRALRAFGERFKISYRILRYNQEVMEAYFKDGPPAIPTVFFVDKEGRLRDKHVGFEPGALERTLQKMLAEAGAPGKGGS